VYLQNVEKAPRNITGFWGYGSTAVIPLREGLKQLQHIIYNDIKQQEN